MVMIMGEETIQKTCEIYYGDELITTTLEDLPLVIKLGDTTLIEIGGDEYGE